MSAQPQFWAKLLPESHNTGIRQSVAAWDISLRVAIDADARRVLNAVSIPEYLETWIRSPEGDHCVATSQANNGYSLDFYRAGAVDVSITGAYEVCSPSDIVFTWRKNNGPNRNAGRVCIHLEESPLGTILELRHSGLNSVAESQWHRTMWCRSLAKLGWLLERCRPCPSD